MRLRLDGERHAACGGARSLRAACAGILAAVGLFAASAASGAAGLQVDELRIDAQATTGVIGRVTVSNPSAETIKVTMTPRRWRQGLDGRLLPDMRKGGVLNTIAVNAKSFSLSRGAKRVVEIRLKGTPKKRFLYAALVARGVANSKKAGLRPSYQIAIALSLRPPAARQVFRQRVSAPRVRARKGGGLLIDTIVRNDGNMVTPPSGTYVVRGAGVTRTVRIAPRTGILPAHRVRLPSVTVRGLRAGRYRVTATLRQRTGRNGGLASARKSFRILRGGRVTR